MILLELVYPLKTHMEKRERLNELRKGKLPENFVDNFKSLSWLILSMTDNDPSKRPSAKSVVILLEIEIERLCADKSSPKRNRFFSDDVKDRKYKDFEMELKPIANEFKNYSKFVNATHLKCTNCSNLIESTVDFSLEDVFEENVRQTMLNCFLKSVYNEDSWELIGGKNIDGKVIK
jgi:hypothetical protein